MIVVIVGRRQRPKGSGVEAVLDLRPIDSEQSYLSTTLHSERGAAREPLAACATFHDCNSRKQFEARAVPKQGTRCARAEGRDRDLAGELQGAQESSVNLSPPR